MNPMGRDESGATGFTPGARRIGVASGFGVASAQRPGRGYQARPPLQAVYGVLGVIILLLSMTESARRPAPPSTTSRR